MTNIETLRAQLADAQAREKIAREAVWLADAQAREKIAREAVWEAGRALDAALLEEALANPHPWVGRAVYRMARHGWNVGQVKRISGVVAAYDPAKHRRLRGLPYRIEPGTLLIVTKSNKSAYSFDINKLATNETEWQLENDQ